MSTSYNGEGWFNPTQHSDQTLGNKQDELLEFLGVKGVSFTSELSRELGINIEEANRIIYLLKNRGFINRIRAVQYDASKPFEARMHEFWAQGIIGYERFVQMSFWCLTPAGIELLKAKKKRVVKSIIEYYEAN